jgi:uncharacterized membrane protein
MSVRNALLVFGLAAASCRSAQPSEPASEPASAKKLAPVAALAAPALAAPAADAIYATAWDGTVNVRAHLDGRIEVVQ